MKFRKKPVTIEAIKYDGKNGQEIADFITCGFAGSAGANLIISTLEGQMAAAPGDWIIKGVNGEFYPCKPDIFFKTYEDPSEYESKEKHYLELQNLQKEVTTKIPSERYYCKGCTLPRNVELQVQLLYEEIYTLAHKKKAEAGEGSATKKFIKHILERG